MSEEKEGLISIKVCKFNNTKESFHEVTLKFRVIADDRGYHDIIEGIVGSHQVCFPMCTLETLQKYCSTNSLLLTFC